MKYIREGNRYDVYVRDCCKRVAGAAGVREYDIGYQNHTNRPGVLWTQPDVERVIAEIDAQRVVVDPVSFMHEQSETLAELDHELREEAEERGLGFHRVPIPHRDPAFIGLLAELVEAFLHPAAGAEPASALPLGRCRCRSTPGTYCLNSLTR